MANPTANVTRLNANPEFYSFQIGYTDLAGTSGSGAKTWNLITLPQGTFIQYIRIKHSVAFSGGSISAMTVSVGKSTGVVDFFVKTFDIYQTVYDGALSETFAPAMGGLAAVTLTATLTPTGDTCANVTAGVVNIDVAVSSVKTPDTMPVYGSSTTRQNVL